MKILPASAFPQAGAAIACRVGRRRARAVAGVVHMPGQRIGSAANRAQIVDADFDVTPYLAQLKNAGVKTIGRYYDRAYGTGIGEVCYHHKSKTLTKAELTAIERAGLFVYVVFQHCGAQCVNFDMAKQGDRRQGAQGRRRRGAAGARSRPARGHADLFRDRLRSVPRQRLPAARRAHLAEHRAYFDQINEVFAHTRWQVGVYGAGVTCKRLKESGKAKFFWLSTSLGHPGSPRVLQRRRVASVSERHRDQAKLRARYVRHRRCQSGEALFWRLDVARAGADARSRRARGHPGQPRLRQERLRHPVDARQPKCAHAPKARAFQLDVPHPDGGRARLFRSELDRGR